MMGRGVGSRQRDVCTTNMAQWMREPVAIRKSPGYDLSRGARRPQEKGHAALRRGRVLGGNAIGVVNKGKIAA